MRRVWLSLVLVLSLVVGGVASAWAANDCPYLKSAVAGEHDCCPDGAMTPDDTQQPGKGKTSDACKLGQACRTTVAVTPFLTPISQPSIAPTVVRQLGDDTSVAPGPVFGLWKPPRI